MLPSTKIPQVNKLDDLRTVVQTIEVGAGTHSEIARWTGFSMRHVAYALHAVKVLNLVDVDAGLSITKAGEALLVSEINSPAETEVFRGAIEGAEVVKRAVPSLLSDDEPDLKQVAKKIMAISGLAPGTAERRARTLLSWRRQLLFERTGRTRGRTGGLRTEATSGHVPLRQESLYLNRIQIRNFGPIKNADTALGRFCISIGRNGVGKSTFMDSIGFVADCARKGVEKALFQRATQLSELLWFGKGSSFALAFEFSIPTDLRRTQGQDLARYELEIGPDDGGDIGILAENLFMLSSKSPRANGDVIHQRDKTPRGWYKVLSNSSKGNAFYRSERSSWKTVFSIGHRSLALSSVPADRKRFPVTSVIQKVFRRGVQKLALHAPAMRKPCSPLKSSEFEPDGSNLPIVVRDLAVEDPVRFQEWLAHLKEAIPDIQDVSVAERPGDNHLFLLLKYSQGAPLPSWRVSEGTLRILALTLIPFIKDDHAVFMIEEPENGIHPQAIEAVFETLAYPFNKQILVATHSPVFVGIGQLCDFLVFSKHDGATRIVRGEDHPVLRSGAVGVDIDILFAADVIS